MHRVILWSQGQTVFSVQSQKTEGWPIETLLQYETICDLTLGLIRVRIGTFWNESGTLFCGAASNSAVQHDPPTDGK
jgi:hypothetical protein